MDKIYSLLQILKKYVQQIANIFFITHILFYKNKSWYKEILNDIKINKINIKYKSMYLIYANYELILTEILLYFYVIFFILIILLSGKRVIFGGFKNMFSLYISYYVSFICFLSNIISFILSLLIIFLTIFPIMADIAYIKNNKNLNIIIFMAFLGKKLYLFFLYLSIIICSPIIWKSYSLFKLIKEIRSDYNLLGNNDNDLSYKFIGLDLNVHNLNEYIINGYPRALFYLLDEKIDNKTSKDVLEN